MSEDISVRSPAKHVQVGKRWLAVMKRVLVGVVLILAVVVGLIVDVAELVGIWAAYGTARGSVITVSNTLQQALQVADKRPHQLSTTRH